MIEKGINIADTERIIEEYLKYTLLLDTLDLSIQYFDISLTNLSKLKIKNTNFEKVINAKREKVVLFRDEIIKLK